MPVSKNRRKKRQMKPRTFLTQKSARRYLSRFKWQYLSSGKYYPDIRKTFGIALMMRTDRI